MANIGTAYVDIEGNYGPLKKGAKRGVSPAAKVAGAAIAAGIGVALKGAIDEAREATKATAQTNAVIESTGGVANVTAKELGNLSNAISAKAGIDDEAIQSAGNLLLTFKDVRDEVGRGNDVFSQALPVITDMSVAMKQDLKSSTIQVGKALNDPIKGMTALARVGVTFTKGQKDQVKALVESGDKMAAQKIILRELKSEFEGSAGAQADPFDKFRVAIDNLKETVGMQLLPVLGDAADILSDWMLQLQTGTGPLGRFGKKVGIVFDEVKSVVLPALEAVKSAFGDLTPTFQGVAVGAAGALAIFAVGGPWALGIAAVVAGAVLIKRNWETIGPIFEMVKTKIVGAFQDAAIWVKGAISTIAQALDLGGDNMRQFGNAVRNVVDIAKVALGALATYWKFIFEKIVLPVVKRVMPGIQQIFQGVFRTIGGLIKLFTGIFTGDFRKMWEGIKQIFSGALKALGGVIRAATAPLRAAAAAAAKGVWNGIKSVGGLIYDAGKWLVNKAIDGIQSRLKGAYSIGRTVVTKTIDGVKSLGGVLVKLGKWIIDKIKSGFSTLVPKIKAPDLNPFNGGGGDGGKAIGGSSNIVQLGRSLQGMGYAVGEHPAFGGVAPVHSPNSLHYSNRAIDVNADSMAGGEMKNLDRLYGMLKGKAGISELLWRVPNHFNHLHVAMRRGGKAGPGSGGPSVVYGEGKKDEWWISQEGDKRKNTRWGVEALESVSGSRVALFKKGGKKKKLTAAQRAARSVRIFNAKADREDAKDAAYVNSKYDVNLKRRLKRIDALMDNRHLSSSDRNALLNMRGQVWSDLHPATDDGSDGHRPDPNQPLIDAMNAAAEAAQAQAAAQQAQAAAQRELQQAVDRQTDFADRMHTATKGVTDKTLQAILDKTLGGQLSQMMLTLSPRMAT